MKKNESKLVKYTLIAICLIFVFLFLVLPLYIVFAEAFRDGIEKYREAVTDKYTISAVLLTLEATVFAVVVNTVFGVFASWAITKFNFKGKKFLTTLIDLPVTISPIIAGLIFVLTFGRQSILYPALQSMGIKVVFAVPGIILATVFVTFPFISRELIPVLEAEGTDEEEAAALMGASGFTIPSYKMGIPLWCCTLCCKSNGRVWCCFCTFWSLERKDKYTPSPCRDTF